MLCVFSACNDLGGYFRPLWGLDIGSRDYDIRSSHSHLHCLPLIMKNVNGWDVRSRLSSCAIKIGDPSPLPVWLFR
jgi:hypothetical protein